MSTPTDQQVSMVKGESSIDKKEVSMEKGESSSTDQKEVSTEKGEASIDKKEVSMEKGESAIDKKEVSMEKGESSTEQKQVSTEKGESSTEQKQVSTEKGESSTDHFFENWIPTVSKLAKELYNFSEQHFRSTTEARISDINDRIGVCIRILDSVPQENRQSEYENSRFEYLRGKVYNAIPGVYNQAAEHHLRIATNLDPDLLDAWNCLAICLAKKGDYHGAKKYFQFVIQKDEHSIILRQLAELELVQGRVAKDQPHHIAECIKYAKRTLTLDDKDGRCLFILGSAYFTSFLLDGGWNLDKVLLALDAYGKAEKILTMKSDPNLQYDSGLVNRFQENYKKSLICLSNAVTKNPALDASHQLKLTLQLLDKLEGLLQGKSNDKSKGKSKGKSKEKSKGKSTETSLSSLIKSLATIDLNPSYNNATMDLLTKGLNKGIAVIGVIRCLVKYDYNTPVYYVLCDSKENSFVLTVFGIRKEAIKQGDQVTLLEPFCKFVDCEWEGKHYQFKSVRVNLLEQVLVNGNVLSPNFALRESILHAKLRA